MREHVLVHEEKKGRTDQGTLVLDISYECPTCGSGVIGTINLDANVQNKTGLDLNEIRSRMRKRLTADFSRKFPKDCDEAKKLNICREIHDS